MDQSSWVPMRWPEDWRDPSLLDLLRDTPINCLVVEWDNERPPAAVLEQGRRLGLRFVGHIESTAGRAAALQSAQAAGLDAVALDNPKEAKLPAIAWAEKSKLPWSSGAAVFAAADAVWPGIPSRAGERGGPTAVPWVDANGWFLQLARTLAHGKPVWLATAPPQAEAVRTPRYLLAIADACAYGGRWVITLDDKLRASLAARSQDALDEWKAITGAVRFFETHREWSSLAPYANLAVLSDFSGANEFASQELLNLLARRGVPYRIIEKSRADATEWTGIKGILFPDEQPPGDDLKKKLLSFVEGGGTLIVQAKWPAPAGLGATSDALRRWNLYAIGKGRLAIAKDESQDPYVVAADAQILLSHRNDVVRYFNFGTMNGYYTSAAGGRRAVLHVVNYTTRTSSNPVSITLPRRYEAARLWRLDTDSPAPLEVAPAEMTGVEIHLPPFGVYAAIELEAAG
jgi:hypothetical protein